MYNELCIKYCVLWKLVLKPKKRLKCWPKAGLSRLVKRGLAEAANSQLINLIKWQ